MLCCVVQAVHTFGRAMTMAAKAQGLMEGNQPAVVQPGTSKLGPNRALEAYLRGLDRAVDSLQVQP